MVHAIKYTGRLKMLRAHRVQTGVTGN